MVGIHCRREKLIDGYVVGLLSEKQRKSCEAHFKICEGCRKILETIQEFYDLLSAYDSLPETPEVLREKLRAQIMSFPSYKKRDGETC